MFFWFNRKFGTIMCEINDIFNILGWTIALTVQETMFQDF